MYEVWINFLMKIFVDSLRLFPTELIHLENKLCSQKDVMISMFEN